MVNNYGKKPGGDVGRKVYKRKGTTNSDPPRTNDTSTRDDASGNADTAMVGDVPGIERPTLRRVTRSSTKRKLPDNADVPNAQSQSQRKKQKTDEADADNPQHGETEQGPPSNVHSINEAELKQPGAMHTSPEDFVANFQHIKKRNIKTTSTVQWDTTNNRPATMVRIGYGHKEEEEGAYIKQTPMPLLQDRVIPSAATEPMVESSSQSLDQFGTPTPSQNNTLLMPQIVNTEIRDMLKELDGYLNPVQTVELDYTEADLEQDSNKSNAIASEPKRQQPKRSLNDKVKPFSDIASIFSDIANKAEDMGFLKACEPFERNGLQVVTMCSGTESPLLALDLLKRAFTDRSHLLNIQHVASAEIIPFKQAYIHRNFQPQLLFRDVTEFNEEHVQPHTAFGGIAKQPTKIHMLIAGSSCIDYSFLNNKRKDFGEKGQSFATLKGIAAYCFRAKPAVVILENVDGAPWPQIVDLYKEIGYTGLVFKVDSKDFYIPQTRTRGYMVAFHTETAKGKNFVLKQMFESVAASLNTFKQRATVPYTHFIYSDDDPDLSIARHKLITAAKESRRSIISWTACRHRYAAHRAAFQLGAGRPYTQWRADGTCRPMDIAWVDWLRVQRERIWETIDINFLYYLRQREYDMSYKSRWIELSQNVDRDTDQRQWGIIGCLTPSGMPMETRRGGPVTGRESLALQGIPADKLLLNKETSSQMQDMAGNAMTTTVIGSVIFSAIIASVKKNILKGEKNLEMDDSIFDGTFRVIQDKGSEPEPLAYDLQALEDIQRAAKRWRLQESTSIEKQYQPPTITEVAKRAAMAMQLCRCEGALDQTSSKIVVCLDCSSTCCTACKGNPTHVAGQVLNLNQSLLRCRATASSFHEYVQEVFPSAIDVLPPQNKVNLVTEHIAALREELTATSLFGEPDVAKRFRSGFTKYEEVETYLDAVSDSLQHTLTLTNIKRDKIIRIIYESPTARLEFQVQFDRTRCLAELEEWNADLVTCAWYLFPKPREELAAGSPVREALQSPVLKMIPKHHLLDAELQVNNLQERQLDLLITPKGELPETAFESSLGIQHRDYQNIQKWPGMHIQATNYSTECQPIAESINGLYKSLSSCGGASGTLHVKLDQPDEHLESSQGPYSSGMFLLLDPAPFRNASFDSMVFSSIHERLPHGVSRRVEATIEARWRPFQLKEPKLIHAITDQVWHRSGLFLISSRQAEEIEVIQSIKPSVRITSMVCKEYHSIAACRLPRSQQTSAAFSTEQCIDVEIINQPEAMKSLQGFLKTKWRSLGLEDWQEISFEPNFSYDHSRCVCNPTAPKLNWRLATAPKRDTVIIKPFEDVQAATQYEKDLREIPDPVKALLHCHKDGLVLDLKLNLDSVAHRVLTILTKGKSAEVDLKWRLARDSGLENVPSFEVINIPGYTSMDRRIDRTQGLKPSIRLTAWQEQSAFWMNQQELAVAPWYEFERLEFPLPALQQRLDVEGMKKVSVKGGILADAVGSGKTLTSMVLPARDAYDKVSADHEHEEGLIPAKATLFLIPHSLFDQWKTEKNNFISDKADCIFIKTYADLKCQTIEKFLKAYFIFVSWDVFRAPYWDQLRRTTNAFNVPSLAGRGFDQWLREANNDLRDLVAISKMNGEIDLSKFNRARIQKREAFENKYKEQFSAFRKERATKSQPTPKEASPSKVLEVDISLGNKTAGKGKNKVASQKAIVAKNIAGAEAEVKNRQTELYQPAHAQARDDEKLALDYDACDWSQTDLDELRPLLHMFSYRRLVVDEFTYLRDQTVSAIANLSANRRWMLSGTPPLHEYIGVSYMAKLLGTKITPRGEDDILINFIKANKSLIHDKTSAEEFKYHLEIQSPAWISKRNERAKAFVDQFVRQNHRETKSVIKYHLEVADFSLLESYLYSKAFQSVNGQVRETESLGKTKLQADAILSRDAPFLKYFEKKKSAVGAMMWCIPLLLEEYIKAFQTPSDVDEARDIFILKALIKEKDEVFADLVFRIMRVLATALSAWHSDQILARQKAALAAQNGRKSRKTKVQKEADEEEVNDDEEENGTNKEGGSNNPLAVYLENILKHRFGDRSVSGVLSRVAKACSREHAAICAHHLTKIEVGAQGEVATQKELAIALFALTREVVQIAQERRLLKQVLALGLDQAATKCHVCSERVSTLSDLTVMSLCGHIVCTECLSGETHSSELLNGCLVLGCSGSGKDSSVSAVRFSRSASEVEVGGTKVSHLLQVLGTIRRDSAGDRVLVFLQGERQKEMVAAIQKGFGQNPRAVVDGSGAGSATKVSAFGENRDGRILILSIDDINAAGWNLQSCNHVVFVRPYVSKTRADWLATRKQAIGRCARHGQVQTVHVYDLLSSATLEMELFQVRLGGRLVSGDGGWAFQLGGSPDLGEKVVGPRLGSLEEGEEEDEAEE